MPNFKRLAKAYEKDALKTLQGLLQIDSSYDEASVTDDAPYGKGVKKALDFINEFAKKDGFLTDSCKGHATEIKTNQKGKIIGMYAHSDVVPASGKWDNPPFAPVIKGEGKEAKIFARGSSDDKGPLVAAYYAMKLLKDHKLDEGYQLRLVAGGDEERGSSCLSYYFDSLNKQQADYSFTPDADFPLIYAEKGIAHGTAVRLIDLKPIIAMDGGVVVNAVNDKLLVSLPNDPQFASYFKEKKIAGDISLAGEIMLVSFKGKSAHGSTPELGINAALIAFQTLGEFYKIPYLVELAKLLSDSSGASFGGYHLSEELGATTYCVGLVSYNNNVLKFSLDFRFGEGCDVKKCLSGFQKATKTNLTVNSEMAPLLFDKKSPLVSTLMKSYKHMTHHYFDKPLAIGGGTYAKEAKNCVAYGSAFKGHPGDIHSPNEYLYLSDFYQQIAIYADALYRLGHIK